MVDDTATCLKYREIGIRLNDREDDSDSANACDDILEIYF